ncbi:glycerol-3-phosphate 1-O-acyltransferase PlsY [Helcococcus kunzii]|uniref:Glycerol-3-phosphate acyltransferase n=1 Tax=Helcococcus kunzii ATCC 51366 TaxID=883114 RepID=H3NN83_9FIRM|nr:glycerol-3-phosphate 1-O-acyltransferase PlsY [Helcococcus kunzii]EHR34487.1 acyl-phosphate glycerol 3-phosphate acyltransferase [Helcococcus kunzii ATCC 51366]MCT1795486.1 glycerol-3-phosphate 1-O-acyltransferase PlsY [Helcococcus kunzii]MCT1989166.1 glycerol-3-phosphate 1-O-acyltransferase PlsY [Helcococcus kunzii]QUY64732.1 glycerol-3-phosphate 1-O-acyltransferase PlsY [Helcococcus kunzii]QZO77141.1 glycerol-3-phosphate 1-O-acyltransferase PlsY [Helcococcus kunzii]
MIYVIVFLISYLLGSISGSLFVSNVIFKQDIRTMGSGNAGTTNIYRAYGMKYAVLSFAIDIGKGLLASFIGYHLNNQYGAYIAGTAVVIGHVWTIFHKFKGGKGMATSISVFAFHDYKIVIMMGLLFLFFIKTVKIVSLASIILTVTALIYVVLFHSHNTPFIIMTIINSIIVIYSHRSNIKRLIEGTENKIKRMDG